MIQFDIFQMGWNHHLDIRYFWKEKIFLHDQNAT